MSDQAKYVDGSGVGWLRSAIDKIYAKLSDVYKKSETYSKTEIDSKIPNTSGFVTTDQLSGYVQDSELEEYVKESDLQAMTDEEIDAAIAEAEAGVQTLDEGGADEQIS